MRGNTVGGLLLSTDAKKASDRVAWDYLWEVLKRVGLAVNMIAWIKALYSHPRAQVKLNGIHSVVLI